MDPGADALIKAVVADFGTAEGRSIARDGLNEKFAGSKPAEIKTKCIEALRRVRQKWSTLRLLQTPPPLRRGCDRLANTLPRLPRKGGFLGIGGVTVSEAEQATLAEISNALKLAA